MLRLANSLHSTHDLATRKQHLLKGLCDLVRGVTGACIVSHYHGGSDRHVTVSEANYPASADRFAPEHSAAIPLQEEGKDGCRSGPSDGCVLESTVRLADSAVSATIRLYRPKLSARRFTQRAQSLVNLFHQEMSWVYQADVILASPGAMTLSPRERQTLELLLAGLGEKQIASRLHLSPNTVHHYVKSIHRHFGVSSRSELLARWVGR